MGPRAAPRLLAVVALLLVGCGSSELQLGLPEAPGMLSGLLGLRPSGGGDYEDLYGIDLRTRDGLASVRSLEAGPKAPAFTLDLLLFACSLGELGLDPGPIAISPELGIEPPPTSCLFEARLDQEADEVAWQPLATPSAAASSLRYSSREPTCPRDETLHRCPGS